MNFSEIRKKTETIHQMEMMQKYGGHFHHNLAKAFFSADGNNFAKLYPLFKEDLENYGAFQK